MSFDEILLGKMAVEAGLLTPADLERCLDVQRRSPRKRLGAVLIEEGLLSHRQVVRLLLEQSDRIADEDTEIDPVVGLFGMLLVEEGFATEEQVERCLFEQGQLYDLRLRVRLGELLVNHGYMTPADVERALRLQNKIILRCPECDVRYNISSFEEGTRLRCFDCQQELLRADGSVVVERTINVRRVRKIVLDEPFTRQP